MSFIIGNPPGGGGGSTLENVSAPKGMALFPPHFGTSPPLYNTVISNNLVRFCPNEMIQIYQDTQIQEIRHQITVASATDNLFIGLYKYDYTNDKFVLSVDWTISNCSTVGFISESLVSPVTITPATYFVGFTSLDGTVQTPSTAASSGSSMWQPFWKADGNYNSFSVRFNTFFTTITAGSGLPAEILNSSITYFNSGFPTYNPKIIF
jgi:hypothetical protein